MDIPNERKRHEKAVPLVGGLAIYSAVALYAVISPFNATITTIILCSSAMVIIGAIDDFRGLHFGIRLILQSIPTITVLFILDLTIRKIGFGHPIIDAILGTAGGLFTIAAVLGLTNGFNMADGIDGLAASHFLIGGLSIIISIWIFQKEISQISFLLMVMSCAIGFILVNLSLTPLNKVFLGDAGSLFLGFLMAWLLIYYSQRPVSLLDPVSALWCVTVPVFDTIVVIVRRLINNQSPFLPDRTHLHHWLLQRGFSTSSALYAICILAICINAFGIWLTYVTSSLISIGMYTALMLIFGAIMLTQETKN